MPHKRLALLLLWILLVPGVAMAQQRPASESQPESGLRAKATLLLQKLEDGRTRLNDLGNARDKAEGYDRQELEKLYQAAELDIGGIARDLGDLLVASRDSKDDLGDLRSTILEIIERVPDSTLRVLNERNNALAAAIRERDSASPEKRLQAEQDVTTATKDVDNVYDYFVRHVLLMESLGLDSKSARETLEARLTEQADKAATRIALTLDDKDYVERLLAVDANDGNARLRSAVLEERFESVTASLRREVELLDKLGKDTTEYRTLLVKSTGDLTALGLDLHVAISFLQDLIDRGTEWLARNSLTLLMRTLIILAVVLGSWLLARQARRFTRWLLDRTKAGIPRLMRETLVGIAGMLVLVIGLLVVLSQIGIAPGPMLAGLGIAGIIVGFALQDTLSNFASGALIIIYQPYDIGDLISAGGAEGHVQKMSLVSTTILTVDHQTLIVPNSKIWGDVIRNMTLQRRRRVDLSFGVSYADDIEHVETVLHDIVAAHPKVLEDPEPIIKVHELGDSAVKFVVRPWVLTPDYWDVYWDLTRTVKRRFDAEGISIPFPQQDVYLRDSKGQKEDKTPDSDNTKPPTNPNTAT